jgi:hypothetical protein
LKHVSEGELRHHHPIGAIIDYAAAVKAGHRGRCDRFRGSAFCFLKIQALLECPRKNAGRTMITSSNRTAFFGNLIAGPERTPTNADH